MASSGGTYVARRIAWYDSSFYPSTPTPRASMPAPHPQTAARAFVTPRGGGNGAGFQTGTVVPVTFDDGTKGR